MSNIIDFPGPPPEYSPSSPFAVPEQLTILTAPRWRCPKHGDTDQVMAVYAPRIHRTVCVACLLEVLDLLDLKHLPRVE